MKKKFVNDWIAEENDNGFFDIYPAEKFPGDGFIISDNKIAEVYSQELAKKIILFPRICESFKQIASVMKELTPAIVALGVDSEVIETKSINKILDVAEELIEELDS